ncbi:hypothetical protein GGI02_002750 [Coemansia sp. RSA 2322]|nr:hypothetical protein GGI02_002750 [Coemansia sp. RSA 2322]
MAGYNCKIRLYDRVTGWMVQTIRFWDMMSGSCVKSLRSHLGEVTSVATSDSGMLLLSSSKDNSNRLWDLRSLKRLCCHKGHQNTSKNFIRSGFVGDSLIVGGSEDGMVYLWDRESTNIVQRLSGHQGIVYDAKWNAKRGTLCSASDDWTLITTTMPTWVESTNEPSQATSTQEYT